MNICIYHLLYGPIEFIVPNSCELLENMWTINFLHRNTFFLLTSKMSLIGLQIMKELKKKELEEISPLPELAN